MKNSINNADSTEVQELCKLMQNVEEVSVAIALLRFHWQKPAPTQIERVRHVKQSKARNWREFEPEQISSKTPPSIPLARPIINSPTSVTSPYKYQINQENSKGSPNRMFGGRSLLLSLDAESPTKTQGGKKIPREVCSPYSPIGMSK